MGILDLGKVCSVTCKPVAEQGRLITAMFSVLSPNISVLVNVVCTESSQSRKPRSTYHPALKPTQDFQGVTTPSGKCSHGDGGGGYIREVIKAQSAV